MKTKHHFTAALIDAGIDEKQALTIAEEAFTPTREDGVVTPAEWIRKEIKRVEDIVGKETTYINALRSASEMSTAKLYRGAEA